ncbi:hypothetical protein B0J11DRAFT_134028 [Dendryphion nanum]|uniref:Uncharacterized protein n=1 Tax=Dendryphion nanum TaxID=256645 RepID=A0A9P9ICD5_9PLEO|nr:hypothetical protein B0J11DRAFT_134028 [Dendryphion nanum]
MAKQNLEGGEQMCRSQDLWVTKRGHASVPGRLQRASWLWLGQHPTILQDLPALNLTTLICPLFIFAFSLALLRHYSLFIFIPEGLFLFPFTTMLMSDKTILLSPYKTD